jgi:hypothetical protein
VKIFTPVITEKGDDIWVSARVETNSCPVALPDTLWFSFPRRFCDYVTGDMNGFAAALLPLAMTLGEDMYMEGVLSPRLLSGMEEYQRIQCAWNPSPFLPVSFEPEMLEPTIANSGGGVVGSSFSGGVDSAYTLWSHLPENERNPSYRISHCLIINGFDDDLDLDGSGRFAKLEQAMQPMMDRIGTQLVVCKTNYMAFSDKTILKQTFAAMVTAPALVLGGLFSTFYVPSSYRFDDFYRDGSHLMLDHLIATETMETIHEGSHLKRTDKTEVISKWSETYRTLRVCGSENVYDEETNSVLNCCRCEKCIRTMMTLELYGKLDKYKSFPRPLSHFDIWRCNFSYKGTRIFAYEIISEAFKARRYGMLINYCISFVLTYVIMVPKYILRQIHLFIENRSSTYEKLVRRIYPGLRRKPPMIK